MNRNPVPGAYYIFVIPGFEGNSGMAGYMPLKSGYGFITPTTSPEVVAHELGHGAFNLRHTFSQHNVVTLPQGTTFNLMDYPSANSGQVGAELWKYQWDFIHDPEGGWYLWEDSEEGASQKADSVFFAVLIINSNAYFISKREELNNAIIQKVKDDWSAAASLNFIKWDQQENYIDEEDYYLIDRIRFYEIESDNTIRKRDGNARIVINETELRTGDWRDFSRDITSNIVLSLEIHLTFSTGVRKYYLGNAKYVVEDSPRPLRVLSKRSGYNDTHYPENEMIGFKNNGEASILQGEELTFILEEQSEDGNWVQLEDVLWKTNNVSVFSMANEFTLEIIGDISFIEAKKEEESDEFRFGLNVERPRDNLPGFNEFLNVNVDLLNRQSDKNRAKNLYTTAINTVSTGNSQLYDLVSQSELRINVSFVRNQDMPDNNYAGQVSRAAIRRDFYDLAHLDRFEFDGIAGTVSLSQIQSGNYNNHVISGAKLVSRLSEDEVINIEKATLAKNVTLLRPALRQKLEGFDSDIYQQFIHNINNGNFNEIFISSLKYEISSSELSRYVEPDLTFNITYNYDHPDVVSSQASFTGVVIHEFKHIQFFLESFYDAIKWIQLRDVCVGLVDFRDNNADAIGCTGCSSGAGHERHNPENCFVCP